MRVLWLVKGLGPGGAERLLVAAAASHDRAGFDLESCYLVPWKDALVADLAGLGVPSECIGVGNDRDLRWMARLRERLVRRPVDVLHAHSPYPAALARLVARSVPRAVRPRLVFTVHNTWHSFAPLTRSLNGATFALDDADIAVSSEVHDTLPPGLRRRTEVVVHGIRLDEVAAQNRFRPDVRRELGLNPDEIVIGTIANFRRQKDYPNLLAAARILADRGVPARIVAVGQGQLEGETRALHTRLGLGNRVVLLGRREDAVKVLAACDVFTLASHNEGLPVALMEALALGLPVVATAVGGVPGAVTNDVEGILVPPKEPVQLADALAKMAADPALRARMGAAAARTARRFDIRVAVRRIEDLYRRVLAS